MIRRTFLKALMASPLGLLLKPKPEIGKKRSGIRKCTPEEISQYLGTVETDGRRPLLVGKDEDFTFSTCGWWSGSFRLEHSYDGRHWDEFRTWTGDYSTNIMFSCPHSTHYPEAKFYRVIPRGKMHGPTETDYPAKWRLRVGHFDDKGVLV